VVLGGAGFRSGPGPGPDPDGLLLRTADSPFSYACRACSRCCHGRRIPVNPYEILRLAANRGLGTGELLDRFVTEDGTALLHGEGGACLFLDEGGCSVHPDRPLACRLYPLGAVTLGAGLTAFVELEPHPDTEGEYGEEGTVGGYLDAQGAGPYLKAAARYRGLLARAVERLGAESSAAGGGPGAGRGPEDRRAWLDVDATVEGYAEEAGLTVPSDPEEKTRLHLLALARALGIGDEPAARPGA
jgi:hypothetical protein